MKKVTLALAASVMMATPALSETTPPGSRLDSRVRIVKHVDGQVYVLRTGLTRATTVEFENGERIVSIVAGDTESFSYESIPGDRVFAVKPTAKGVRSNVTVYTNRRSYYFTIQESSHPFYVLRFNYPEQKRNPAGRAVQREANARSYGVSESNEITPSAIWDDGAFTYFKFPTKAPIPAVFKVTNGRERSVNSSTLEDRTVRVSGVSRQWALRIGGTEVCIAEILP